MRLFRRLLGIFIMLLLGTVFALGLLVGRYAGGPDVDAAQDLLQVRAMELQQARLYWQNLLHAEALIPGARSAHEQGLRAVVELEDLYRREERLWSYYAVLRQSVQARQSFVAVQQRASNQITQQEGELARLDALAESLRPDPDATFRFSAPSPIISYQPSN